MDKPLLVIFINLVLLLQNLSFDVNQELFNTLNFYLAVYRPVQYALHTSSRATNLMILLAWCTAATISFPMYINIRKGYVHYNQIS